jgi:hypothetical protein
LYFYEDQPFDSIYVGMCSNRAIELLDSDEGYYINVYQLETTIIKTLDEKYISEDIARVADIPTIPTIPIVDKTLSINGAAAESIAVSNKFDELDEAINDRFNSLTWSDLGDKQQQELVFEVENMQGSEIRPGIENTKLSIGDTCRVVTTGIYAALFGEDYTITIDESYHLSYGIEDPFDPTNIEGPYLAYVPEENVYKIAEDTGLIDYVGTITVYKLANASTIDSKYIGKEIARTADVEAAIKDIELTPGP